MEDIIDLYTLDRKPTGKTAVRYEKLPEDTHRLVVHVCIFSTDGERMVVQRRHPEKRTWPGTWDISVGGGVVTGEDSAVSGEREVKEELGLDVKLVGTAPVVSLDTQNTFDDIYLVRSDVLIEDLVLQPEEVVDAKWATEKEICDMIDAGSFIPYQKGLVSYLFHVAKNGTCMYERK